jgi:hypothetical protein
MADSTVNSTIPVDTSIQTDTIKVMNNEYTVKTDTEGGVCVTPVKTTGGAKKQQRKSSKKQQRKSSKKQQRKSSKKQRKQQKK